MTTLAANQPRDHIQGDYNGIPVIASDIIYEGAAVGIVKASGHARPLTSADKFAGFAEEKADNSAGSAADINVRVRKRGAIALPVTGAVITDKGAPVYAQDDNAFSFVKTSGVFIGFFVKYESSGNGIVAYDVDNFVDPHEGWTAESVAANKTLDNQDTGKVFYVTADAKTITLPAVEGMEFRVVNAGAYGTVAVNISPNASDGIIGPDLTDTDDKDLINTKATAQRGDYVQIGGDDATGWAVTRLVGTWAKEA